MIDGTQVFAPSRAAYRRGFCCRLQAAVVTAELCTGGLVAGALTEIAGSSAVVRCGFVTYSNKAKEPMLGVPSEILNQFGAVSRQTAEAMAAGATGIRRNRFSGDHRYRRTWRWVTGETGRPRPLRCSEAWR